MRILRLSARRSIPLLLLAAPGLAVSWTVERGSVQRGNRLHRSGQLPAAAGIYAEHVAGDSTDSRLRYNLGTTLLGVGVSGAHEELAAAGASEDLALRARSQYNLGVWHLMQASGAASTDSVRAHAEAGVEANKDVLRLRPGRADARWNLAMAQRMLDSIQSQDGRAGSESVDGTGETDDLVQSDQVLDLQDGSPVGDGPQDGEDEALVEAGDLEPLTILEADDILNSDHLDASTMVRKLLAFEAREQRRTRFGRSTPRW